MGLLGRLWSARAASTQAAAADVAPGVALLEEAGRRRAQIVAPSRLSEAVITAGLGTVRIEAGSPLHRALSDAALLGYACRLDSTAPVPDYMRMAIEAHLVRTPDGRLDDQRLIEIPDALHALVRTAVALARSDVTIAATAGVSTEAWCECCSRAASQLRTRLLRSGLPRHRVLEDAFLSIVVRLGAVLCVVDELAGESAARRSP